MMFVGKLLKKSLKEVSEMTLTEIKLWLSFHDIYAEQMKGTESEAPVNILDDPSKLGYNGKK